MRDEKRIDIIIEGLRETWKKHPDLRFLQLISNMVYPIENTRGPCSIFNIEDDVFEKMIKTHSKHMDDIKNGKE